MSDLRIEPVASKVDLKAFIDLPWEVYRGDPYWVPPLLSDQRQFYDRKKNPFFEHGKVEYFLARRGARPVGRIAAIINHLHNEFHQERVGFFGAFEVLEDSQAAAALLEAACSWVGEQGMAAIRGPATFSSNEEWGLLVDGFDYQPRVLTTYNPPRYVDYVEGYGFRKAMDLYAFELTREKVMPQALSPKLVRVVEHLRQRSGVKLRTARMKDYWRETEKVKEIYNRAWTKNWGFVPLTDADFHHMARKLKLVIDPNLAYFVELDGQTVGFSISLPDVNQALRLAYPSPRTPEWMTLIKFLWHWKVRRKVTTLRLFALGFQEDSRLNGLDALLYYETARVGLARGYRRGEISWLLETNTMVNRSARTMQAELYKKWRIYELDLAG